MHTVKIDIENEFFELFAVGIAGIAIHILGKLREQYRQGKINWIDNAFVFVTSVIIMAVLVHVRYDIATIWPMNKAVTLVTGYSAQSVFTNLSNAIKKKPGAGNLGFIIQFLIVSIIFLAMGGCRTENWYSAQFYKMKAKYPERNANDCNSAYPIKESISVRTIQLPGKTEIRYTQIDCDSALNAVKPVNGNDKPGKPNPIYVKVPYEVRTADTIYKEIFNVAESTAALEAVRERLRAAETKGEKFEILYNKSQTTLETKNGIIFKLSAVITAFLLAAAAFIYFKFK